MPLTYNPIIYIMLASKLCTTLSCQHGCKASLDGGACFCKEGMTINPKDQRTCIDLDECKEWGYCDQFCTNTAGSFKCSCAPGYSLLLPRHCKANNSKCVIFYPHMNIMVMILSNRSGTEMKLIFGHHSAIYKTDSQGTSLETITNTTAVSGIDFHYGKNLLFWSDVETRKVKLFLISS